jgi:hypothetical protein
MAPLPKAIQNLFGVNEAEAFCMASVDVVDANARQPTTADLQLINKWLGTVFAIAEHERRRRAA